MGQVEALTTATVPIRPGHRRRIADSTARIYALGGLTFNRIPPGVYCLRSKHLQEVPDVQSSYVWSLSEGHVLRVRYAR